MSKRVILLDTDTGESIMMTPGYLANQVYKFDGGCTPLEGVFADVASKMIKEWERLSKEELEHLNPKIVH